jgi:diadenosine tetraphosphate (Ap4A) HIT family hydrolase
MLYRQQLDIGFVPEIDQTFSYQFFMLKGLRYFLALYNPLRADRGKGSGRKVPPVGFHLRDQVDTKCYLCASNMRWQSRGVQLYYEFLINERAYIAACNPFPILPYHFTIAYASHESQDWAVSSKFQVESKVRLIVEDLYRLAVELAPTFVVMMNGQGAGATLDHLHFHAFEPFSSQPAFPLCVVARYAQSDSPLPEVVRFGGDPLYPLVAFRLVGARAVENTIQLVLQWIKLAGEKATANIVMLTEEGQVVAYFIPRHKDYPASRGLAGLIGGLEVLGQLVLSTADEQKSADEGGINYNYLNSILADVLPPNVASLTIH